MARRMWPLCVVGVFLRPLYLSLCLSHIHEDIQQAFKCACSGLQRATIDYFLQKCACSLWLHALFTADYCTEAFLICLTISPNGSYCLTQHLYPVAGIIELLLHDILTSGNIVALQGADRAFL